MAQQQQEKLNPDQVILNPLQQKHLAIMAGVQEDEIRGKNIAQLSETLKWKIDPYLLFFRKICGKVVKKDADGNEYPIPFATVNVEDTECNLIIYQPVGYPWSWHFPIFCHNVLLGTTTTDACGNFCIWVPRFEFEWILRWRRERICFPILFQRPNLGDYIAQIPKVRKPGPDPGPLEKLNTLTPALLNSIAGSQAASLQDKIYKLRNSYGPGMVDKMSENILNQPLFDKEMPPPLPADLQKVVSGQNVVSSKGVAASDAVRTVVAGTLGLETGAKELQGFNINKFRGPFYRCYDVYVPVWQLVLEVPDISFVVTQGGNTIYTGGYSGSLSNVTLVASSIAKESQFCNIQPVPCGTEPALVLAGQMELTDPSYFDAATGYALRPNPPIPTGTYPGAYSYPAITPFCDTLALSGCVDVQDAQYYRIEESLDGGATWSAITGLSWNNFLASFPFTPIPITADPGGWYAVEPINPVTLAAVPRSSLELPNLLLNWPTPLNETTTLRIVLGDASKTQLPAVSPSVAITSDNTRPVSIATEFSWKYSWEPDTSLRSLLGIPCPMIQRGAVAQDIELVLAVNVSANHFRDASLSTSGCGGGSFVAIADTANKPEHWYENAADNTVTLYQRYSLSAGSLPGCYTFESEANSRAMNPSCADGGCLLPTDWYYNPVYLYSQFYLTVAVVNEDLV